ncbi:amidohydrolase [Maribellus sediminis]|uniref:amidohydrolase n=1 Tax=Maribellus sediminis TaxID=2696285 RepID=UPI001431C7BE|nr:amidohydrolase [Maribellus sediminis]
MKNTTTIHKIFSLCTLLILVLCFSVAPSKAQNGNDSFRASSTIEEKVIDWRRDFHEHPELSNREFRTAEKVAEHLRSLGMEVTEGIAITGVKAVLKGGKPGPVVALRADMDALPVVERTDVPFASKVVTEYNGEHTGVMHACGHDAHTAMLMGVAEILAGMKDDLKGTVVFIFQPAEEGAPKGEEGGAELMIKEGVLENPKVEVIFGQHMRSNLEAGKIVYKPGPMMAGVSDFKIEVLGKGSHGSQPWSSVDPIATAAQIVNSIQTIVSRNINLTMNPAVVTVGAIKGGNRSNIIPETVEMLGTIRVFSDSDQQIIHQRLTEIAENVAEANGAKAIVHVPYSAKYPVTFNNEALTAQMLPTLERSAGKENVMEIKAITGAEDFSFFAQKVPGLYFFIGGMPKGQDPATAAPHHTADFYLDESSFVTGVNAMVNLVLDYTSQHASTSSR